MLNNFQAKAYSMQQSKEQEKIENNEECKLRTFSDLSNTTVVSHLSEENYWGLQVYGNIFCMSIYFYSF